MAGYNVKVTGKSGTVYNLSDKDFADNYDKYVEGSPGAKVTMYDTDGKEQSVGIENAKAMYGEGYTYWQGQKNPHATKAKTRAEKAQAKTQASSPAVTVAEKARNITNSKSQQSVAQPQAQMQTRLTSLDAGVAVPERPYNPLAPISEQMEQKKQRNKDFLSKPIEEYKAKDEPLTNNTPRSIARTKRQAEQIATEEANKLATEYNANEKRNETVQDTFDSVLNRLDAEAKEISGNTGFYGEAYELGRQQEAAAHRSPEKIQEAFEKQFEPTFDNYVRNAIFDADGNVSQRIKHGAAKSGISEAEYAERFVIPTIRDQVNASIHGRTLEKYLPKNFVDYSIKKVLTSTLGSLASPESARGQQMLNEAIMTTQEGGNPHFSVSVKPSFKDEKGEYTWDAFKKGVKNLDADDMGRLSMRLTGDAISFLADSPLFTVGGGLGSASLKVGGKIVGRFTPKASWLFNSAIENAGGNLNGAATLFAKGLTKMDRVKIATRTAVQSGVSGSVNMGSFMSTSGAVSEMCANPDATMSSIGSAYLSGLGKGVWTGAGLGVASPLSVGMKVGAKSRLTKIGAEVGGIGMEIGSMTGLNLAHTKLIEGKDITLISSLDELREMAFMVGAMKLQKAVGEPADFARKIAHLTSKSNPVALSQAEVDFLRNHENGKRLMDMVLEPKWGDKRTTLASRNKAGNIVNTKEVGGLIADKTIPWEIRQKMALTFFNMAEVGGRPNYSSFSVKGKEVTLESYDGTPIAVREFKDAEDLKRILDEEREKSVYDGAKSMYGAMSLDCNTTHDENGAYPEYIKEASLRMVAEAFKQPDGTYNIKGKNYTLDEAISMLDEGGEQHELYKQISNMEGFNPVNGLLYEFADETGAKVADVRKAMEKSSKPHTLLDGERELLSRLHDYLKDFAAKASEGEPAPEASAEQGNADSNRANLTSDEPNTEVVAEVNGAVAEATDAYAKANEEYYAAEAELRNFEELNGKESFTYQDVEKLRNNGYVEAADAVENYLRATDNAIAAQNTFNNATIRKQAFEQGVDKRISEAVDIHFAGIAFRGRIKTDESPEGAEVNGDHVVTVTDNEGNVMYLRGGVVEPDGKITSESGMVIVVNENGEMDYKNAEELQVVENGILSKEEVAPGMKEWIKQAIANEYGIGVEQAPREAEPAPAEAMQPSAEAMQGDAEAKQPETEAKQPQEEEINSKTVKNEETDNKPAEETLVNQEEFPKDSKGKDDYLADGVTAESALARMREKGLENEDIEQMMRNRLKKSKKPVIGDDEDKYIEEKNKYNREQEIYNGVLDLLKEESKAALEASMQSNTQETAPATIGQNVVDKFNNAERVVGRKGSITVNGRKIKGHYEFVNAFGITPSHDPFNDFKQSEGFPVDENGNSSNSRPYNTEQDRAFTRQMGRHYNGEAEKDIPIVTLGIPLSGNGRIMGRQIAAKAGTDKEYLSSLEDNVEGYGAKWEDVKKVPNTTLIFVPDETFDLTPKTFDLFNKNERKTESSAQEAARRSRTLQPDEVASIIGDIEQYGTIDSFYKSAKGIADLLKTLKDKGIIGENEEAELKDGDMLSAKGKEFVENLVLGALFKPEQIERLAIEKGLKRKVINGMKQIMANKKLGEYAIDDAIAEMIDLVYAARKSGYSVKDFIRQKNVFGEGAEQYSELAHILALALEGKVEDFKDYLTMYNNAAKVYADPTRLLFDEKPAKDKLVNEFTDLINKENGRETTKRLRDEDKPDTKETLSGEGNRPKTGDSLHSTIRNGSRKEEGSGETEQPAGGGVEENTSSTDIASLSTEELQKRAKSYEDAAKSEDELYDNQEYVDIINELEGRATNEAADLLKNVSDATDEQIIAALGGNEMLDAVKDAIEKLRKGEELGQIETGLLKAVALAKKEEAAKTADKANGEKPKAGVTKLSENGTLVVGSVPKPEESNAPKQEEAPSPAKDVRREELKAEFDAAAQEAKDALLDFFTKPHGSDKASAMLIPVTEGQIKGFTSTVRAVGKLGYTAIKLGAYDFKTWSNRVLEQMGDFFREKLGWDEKNISDFLSEMWEMKYRLGDEVHTIKEWAESEKAKLAGDSAEYADRESKKDRFKSVVEKTLRESLVDESKRIKSITELRKIAKECGLEDVRDTDLQEMVELAIVDIARKFEANKDIDPKDRFDQVKRLYELQPSLNQRDTDRIMMQQYSTPAPMALLMGRFVNPDGKATSGLEPSAGNGMLTIGLPKEIMHVNEIDEARLSNLQKQGFKAVTNQDGTLSFGGKKYKIVVTNPPFGSTLPKEYDGYTISGLEHQMAINALESMEDDGRAAIIIGGRTEYAQNGAIKGRDKAFLSYLYQHYNVVDVINMSGKDLYSRQGTGYDTRMILIDGRRTGEDALKAHFPPVFSKARAELVRDYDELYKRIEDDILRNNNNPERGRTGTVVDAPDNNNGETIRQGNTAGAEGYAGNANQKPVRLVRTGGSGQHDTSGNNGGERLGEPGDNSTVQSPERERTNGGGNGAIRGGASSNGSGRMELAENGGTPNGSAGGRGNLYGGTVSKRTDGESESLRESSPRQLGEEKVSYVPRSKNPFSLQAKIPAEQADQVERRLEALGDVDAFVTEELGYSSVEDMWHGSQDVSAQGGLAAEQVDSVALAIQQMKKNDAMIIGDQTGIGKGRQGAALIRWATKQGMQPIYFTKTPDLFSGVYRDLRDIGSKNLRPFILASDSKGRIIERVNGEDRVVYDLPSKKEQQRVLDYLIKNGELPPEYDYMVTTYSQINNGTMDYEKGEKKERKFAKGKVAKSVNFNGQKKRDAIESLAANSIVLMDESHEAGGESNTGNYLQYVSSKAKGITFISATFAKRPDNMPLYALRTAISKAGVEIGELIDAVKRGGATFQEVMSKALVDAGQMIRRERDMTGVTVDWKGIEDEEVIRRHYKQYDNIIGLFNEIIDFQKRYVDPAVVEMNDEAAEVMGEVNHTPGTKDMGINNTPFASRTHIIVRQVLLSLKAEEGAKFAVECLKKGEKPVITLENTNEGATKDAIDAFEENMEMPDLSVNLKKGLEGVLRITNKNASGDRKNTTIPLERLGEEAVRRYGEIMTHIENSSSGLSLSPIDVIRKYIKDAGYSVEELTGRGSVLDYNEDGTVKVVKRDKKLNKKRAADFNDGIVDALIVNKSACTGIDLHAGLKFANTNQRHMINVQAQANVNDEVQMRGRTDRTGQKQHSRYTYIVSTIPSEQRLLMMLKSKLRSLDANTTSSQKSKFNEMQVQDVMNKYGDEVLIQYLSEHPDTYAKLADPLKLGDGFEILSPEEFVKGAQKVDGDGATASRILGRMALLTVKEQEAMLDDITELYTAEINRLNDMGENDLEITEMPLRAKTLDRKVWEEGAEPDSGNPFADNTYVETVEMDVLKKPMKAAEIKASQERLLNGKTYEEYRKEQTEKLDKWQEEKKATLRAEYEERAKRTAEKEREKYLKSALKNREKSGMTEAECEKMADAQYQIKHDEIMGKLDVQLRNVDIQRRTFDRVLEQFDTDHAYVLPSDIYDLTKIDFGTHYGKVIGIKISNNFSTASSTVTFATLDGRRKITVPVSGMVKNKSGEKADLFQWVDIHTKHTQQGINGQNAANTLKVLEMSNENWDKMTSSATRKKGYIITGNLLQALVSTRKQNINGKLISYTTDTGEVRQGLLMSDTFDPKSVTGTKPISEAFDLIAEQGQRVTSADGNVSIEWEYSDIFTLRVPKSVKAGGKYFQDVQLLDIVDDNSFYTRGGKMVAEFRGKDNLKRVLDILSTKWKVGVQTDNEGNIQAQPEVRYRTGGKATEHTPQYIETMRSATQSSIDGLGGKGKVVTSEAELDATGRRALKKDSNMKGYYDTATGDVVVYLPNCESGYDAVKTVLHEKVGHEGLRQALGENGYRQFYTKLWMSLSEAERKAISEKASRKEWNFGEAMDETLAEKAEDFTDGGHSFIESVKDAINLALAKLGFSRRLTPRDVRIALWLSKNRLSGNENNLQYKLAKAAFEAKVRRYAPKEPTNFDGFKFVKEDAKAVERATNGEYIASCLDGVYESDGTIRTRTMSEKEREAFERSLTPAGMIARKMYEDRLKRVAYLWTEAHQNNLLSLDILQNAVAGGRDKVKDSENALWELNRLGSKDDIEQKAYKFAYIEPLSRQILRMLPNLEGKDSYDKFVKLEHYVTAKSGLERNRTFAVRDFCDATRLEGKVDEADKIWEEYNRERYALVADLKAGRIDLRGFYAKLDEAVRAAIGEFDVNKADRSGLSDGKVFPDWAGTKKGSYDDDAVIEHVMEIESRLGKDAVEELWKLIDKTAKFAIEKSYTSGEINQKAKERANSMFTWYVPLRGFDEDTAEDMWTYLDVDKSSIGRTLMKAKGRTSAADSPINTLTALGDMAILRGNRNVAKQALVRLVRNNPNNLISEYEAWYKVEKDGEGNTVLTPDYPELREDMEPEEIEDAIRAHEESIKADMENGVAKYIKLKDSPKNMPYRILKPKQMSQHFINVNINGKTVTLVVHSHPRAAQAVNGLLVNNTRGLGAVKWLNSQISQLATSKSATFIARNAIRDYEFASMSITATENLNYLGNFQKMYWQLWGKALGNVVPGTAIEAGNMAREAVNQVKNGEAAEPTDSKHGVVNSMRVLFQKQRAGELNTRKKSDGTYENEVEGYFDEFVRGGGVTGYVQLAGVDTMKEKMQKTIDSYFPSSTTAKVKKMSAKTVGKVFGLYFDAIEAVNEAVENQTRFSTYYASRKAGRTQLRSIQDAKNVSVNFNKTGSGSAVLSMKFGDSSAWYKANRRLAGSTAWFFKNSMVFYNAGVQGMSRSAQMWINGGWGTKKKLAGMFGALPFMLGASLPYLNSLSAAALDDDDDRKKYGDNPYLQLPDYERRHNMCLYIGKGKWIKIPMFIEGSTFFGLGDIAAGYTFYPELLGNKNIGVQVAEAVTQVSPVDALGGSKVGANNVRGALLGAVTPSLAQPAIAMWTNVGWTGSPISRSNEWNENDPNWTKGSERTQSIYVDMAHMLNSYTGGKDAADGTGVTSGWIDIDPAKMQYLVEQYFSSPGKEIISYADILSSMVEEDKDVDWGRAPILKAVYRDNTPYNMRNNDITRWYSYVEDSKKTEHDIQAYRKHGSIDIAFELKYNSKDGKILRVVKSYAPIIKKLKTAKNKATTRADANLIQERIAILTGEAMSHIDDIEKNSK